MERLVEQVFVSANILKASIKHNGFQGGDAGHGGFVELKFKDESCTYMEINGEMVDEISIVFKGDSERKTLLEALKYFTQELERKID